MAKSLRLRRGTTAEHATFVGAEGEVTVDTTKDTLVIHDGITIGGSPLATKAEVAALNASTIVRKDSDTGAAMLPAGSTAQRPVTPADGYIRYNTTLHYIETYNSITDTWGSWGSVGYNQFLGTADVKGIQFMAQSTSEQLAVPTGSNAFSIDNLILENGASITVPDGSVYKIL